MAYRLVRTDRHGTVYEIAPTPWTSEQAARQEAYELNRRRHSNARYWVVRPEPVGARIEVDQ